MTADHSIKAQAEPLRVLIVEDSKRLREQLGLATRGKVELRADLDTGADQLDARVAVKLRDVRHEAARAHQGHSS